MIKKIFDPGFFFTFLLAIAAVMFSHNNSFAQNVSWTSLNGPTGLDYGTLSQDWDGTLYAQDLYKTFKSTDRGEHWILVRNDSIIHYSLLISPSGSFFRTDPLRAFDKSTDKGVTWTPIASQFFNFGVNETLINPKGDILAFLYDSTYKNFVYSSTDDGAHWQLGTDPDPKSNGTNFGGCSDSSGNFYYLPLSFYDSSVVMKTTDLGLTWKNITPHGIAGSPQIVTTGNGTLVLGYQLSLEYRVYRSSDLGATWSYTILPNSYGAGRLAGGHGDTVYNLLWPTNVDSTYPFTTRSTDGGKTWSYTTPGFTQVPIRLVQNFFLDPRSGSLYASGLGIGYWRSDDAGDHWKDINSGLNFSNVKSVTRSHKGSLFAITDYMTPWRNSGGIWNNATISVQSGTFNYHPSGYLNAHDGSLISYFPGGIFRSLNDGTSWQTQFTGWFDALAVNNQAGHLTTYVLAVDSNSTLYAGIGDIYSNGRGLVASTDMGVNWHTLPRPAAADTTITAIEVAPDQSIYIGAGHTLYRSVNNGASWTPLKTLTAPHTFTSISITSSDLIYAAADSEGIFKTTDQGSSWTQLLTPEPYVGFFQVATPANYKNANTIPIMVTASRDTASFVEPYLYFPSNTKYRGYLSLDGGKHWTFYTDTFQPHSAWFDNPTSLIVGTGNQGVWSGTISNSGVAEDKNSFPIEITPNPARDETTVQLHLDRASEISLEIFDETGKLVLPAHHHQYNKGTAEIKIDISKLPAGSYEVRARTAERTEIEKLMIVR